MAIVKMKKLSLFAMREERGELLNELQLIGCVQLTEGTPPEGALKIDGGDSELINLSGQLKRAIALLDKYAPVKTGLFYNRPVVGLDVLFDANLSEHVINVVAHINLAELRLSSAYSDLDKLEKIRLSVLPWADLDVPLHAADTAHVRIQFGGISPSVNVDEFEEKLSALHGQAAVYVAGTDRAQRYLLIVNHKNAVEDVAVILREFGFNRTYFKDVKGTARDNINSIDGQIAETKAQIEALLTEMKEYGEYREDIQLCFDQVAQSIETEAANLKLYGSE
ncbi:MAG: hypothetical protein LBN43_06065, partial [Oscillospiraceae bacterium]|nr:hypothetical protein [Oscillospiraceae bacterium]